MALIPRLPIRLFNLALGSMLGFLLESSNRQMTSIHIPSTISLLDQYPKWKCHPWAKSKHNIVQNQTLTQAQESNSRHSPIRAWF